MAYNSAYTGSQVDAAVGAVRQKETKWDNKQDELTGTEDQLVGFNSAGEATAVPKPTAADVGAMPAVSGGATGQVLTKTEAGQEWKDAPDGLPEGGTEGQVLTKTPTGAQWDDVPSDIPTGGTQGQVLTKGGGDTVTWSDPASGLPDGGAPGQMLYQGESGAEWGDAPVMYVHITGDEESGYQADKTFEEIRAVYEDGAAVFAKKDSGIVPLYAATDEAILFLVVTDSFQLASIYILNDGDVLFLSAPQPAGNVVFTPGTTGLSSDNVQDAIEEVNEKIPSAPKSVSITLTTSGWSSNTQTVTVSGVSADETAQLIQPMPAIASQAAYMAAGIYCSGQAANSLTFTCQTAPTGNITVYVVMQEVSAV